MTAHHLLLDLRQREQQRLPQRTLRSARTHGHDRGFQIAMRGNEGIGREFIAGGTLEPPEPCEAVEVVEEFLLRLRRDLPAPKRNSKIGLSVAFQITEPLKGDDPPRHAEPSHCAREIDRTGSACLAELSTPFAKQLGERISQNQSRVWLVNTGWTGGPHGVGSRMKIAYTRAMIRAALSGQLENVSYHRHPVFNIDVPASVPDVPADVLDPRGTWSDKAAYDAQAAKLARMFVENFKTNFSDAEAKVAAAGPIV